jgi:hypothetical protein
MMFVANVTAYLHYYSSYISSEYKAPKSAQPLMRPYASSLDSLGIHGLLSNQFCSICQKHEKFLEVLFISVYIVVWTRHDA